MKIRGVVERGLFDGRTPYARWGRGTRTLVVLPGGPGNADPAGPAFRLMAGWVDPLSRDFTVFWLARPRGLPAECTTRDLARESAEAIARHLGGRADAVIGVSYGGLVAQHLAADHPDRCGRVVLAAAAWRVSAAGAAVDLRYATLLAAGRPGEAMAAMVDVLAPPGPWRALLRPLARLAGGGHRGAYPGFSDDVLREARAEAAHDATGVLERIRVPVLVIGGTRDFYFPRAVFEETAARIPGAVLRLYEGRGHAGALTDRRFVADVKEFLG
jgi:pimeloyl-ACP methyl ester carboxylesterase